MERKTATAKVMAKLEAVPTFALARNLSSGDT